MSLKISINILYNHNSTSVPVWKFYILDEDGNIINGNCESLYNKSINSIDISTIETDVDIDDKLHKEYTLVVEHTDARFPDDYNEGDFGVEIQSLKICDVDLNDLIYRRGNSYLECGDDLHYLVNQLDNEDFVIDVLPHESSHTYKNYKLFHLRHRSVEGNNPRVFDRTTNSYTNLEGAFVTNDGNYMVKGNRLYYDATNDLCFIAKHSNNPGIYVEGNFEWPWELKWRNFKYKKNSDIGDKMTNLCNTTSIDSFLKNIRIMHHIPNSAYLNKNGRWELKFKTPFYGWVVDNIFGND